MFFRNVIDIGEIPVECAIHVSRARWRLLIHSPVSGSVSFWRMAVVSRLKVLLWPRTRQWPSSVSPVAASSSEFLAKTRLPTCSLSRFLSSRIVEGFESPGASAWRRNWLPVMMAEWWSIFKAGPVPSSNVDWRSATTSWKFSAWPTSMRGLGVLFSVNLQWSIQLRSSLWMFLLISWYLSVHR